MDQPGLDLAEHARALAGLRRVNFWSRTASSVWRPIKRLAATRRLDQVRLLDVGCGGGDLAIRLAERATRSSLDATVLGIDISSTAVEEANEAAQRRGAANVSFEVSDALNDDLPDGYDFVVSTLFLHHLRESDATRLIKRMAAAAGRAVVIDDLIRSQVGYALAWLGCRALSRSPVVHYDGPVSVGGAFTVAEAARLAEEAGLRGAAIRRHWPERFQLVWEKDR